MPLTEEQVELLTQQRDRMRSELLRERADRPPSSARGIHHAALISGDVAKTVWFYQDVLGFPLTEMFENRDYRGSTHFFFDVGNGNALAFFDLPGLDLSPYAEVLGGLHHLAISMTLENWQAARARMDAEGIGYQEESGSSIYFADPDGARVELIADPLGEMYGEVIG